MPDSARLEIHQLNVGQGDSLLIVNRDLDKVATAISAKMGTTLPANPIDYVPYAVAENITLDDTVKAALLVDGGDDEYGYDVLSYLKTMGALKTTPGTLFCPNLSVLVSHYHDDHIAGVRSIFKERVETPVLPKAGSKKRKLTTIISYKERYRPAHVYQTSPNAKADPKTLRFMAFSQDVTEGFTAPANKLQRHFINPGGFVEGSTLTTQITLGMGVNNIPITLHALAAAQGVYLAPNTFTPVPSVNKNTDQNDRSIVLVLEYGSFRFFLGGDIAGNGAEAGGNTGTNAIKAGSKRYFSVHADVESTLGPALETYFPKTTMWQAGMPKFLSDGYCTVLKADHHGSSSSVDVHLLATARPCVTTIGAGIKSRFHNHPTQQVIDRMSSSATAMWQLRDGNTMINNTIQQIYVTEVAQKVRSKNFNLDMREARILGDIVIRPVDETIQAVQAATMPGTELRVQVYGSGEQTRFADAQKVLRPVTTPYTAGAMYPIGPYMHSDLH